MITYAISFFLSVVVHTNSVDTAHKGLMKDWDSKLMLLSWESFIAVSYANHHNFKSTMICKSIGMLFHNQYKNIQKYTNQITIFFVNLNIIHELKMPFSYLSQLWDCKALQSIIPKDKIC